jgi:glucose/arabinose dehydrogenase
MVPAMGPPVTRSWRVARRSTSALALAVLLSMVAAPAGAEVTLPPGFNDRVVTTLITSPTDIEFAPDGRLFVAEQAGRVLIVRPDGSVLVFLNIAAKVDSTAERGLSSITFDPNFASNRYVYLSYTKEATATAAAHNRVVRVKANGNRAVAGSETLIFRLNAQDSPNHLGGAIDFGIDGKLYISTGDGVGGDSHLKSNLLGKLLRINKSGTIPTSNPFFNSLGGQHRAIWLLGFRNPFKFAVEPDVGTIFVNDVGQDLWEEIDLAVKGANYGWRLYEGPESDPAYVDPLFAYGHDGDPATTGCSITGGAFYAPVTAQFPASFDGDYFFADFCAGWIRTYDRTSGEASAFLSGASSVVDLEVASDGTLYYVSRGAATSVHAVSYSAP